VGLFIFGDVEFTQLLIAGLLLSTIASFWYSDIKYRQDLARRQQNKT
jgi:hypothetical protein